jgi:nitrite reductase/ring-hydroxylating ferredoxin subunit
VHNICSHAYAELHEGRLRGHRLICPLHGASFDVRNGAVLGAPATEPLRTYPVRVVDGQVQVQV